MIITCPECHAKFALRATHLGEEGRDVRCGKCRHVWFVKPEEEEQPKSLQPQPEPQIALEQIASPLASTAAPAGAEPIPEAVRPRRSATLPVLPGAAEEESLAATHAATMTFLLLFFVTFAVGLAGRDIFVRLWEPSALFYSAIGLNVPVPGEGVEIIDLIAEYRVGGEKEHLFLRGLFKNKTPDDVAFPLLELEALSEDKTVLKTWRLTPEVGILKPGETTPVDIMLEDAPPEISRIGLKAVR